MLTTPDLLKLIATNGGIEQQKNNAVTALVNHLHLDHDESPLKRRLQAIFLDNVFGYVAIEYIEKTRPVGVLWIGSKQIMVFVHPDHRRCGIAKKLIGRVTGILDDRPSLWYDNSEGLYRLMDPFCTLSGPTQRQRA